MEKFSIGQRWISLMEPELGIGKITDYNDSHITLEFSISNIVRKYAFIKAPIKRVIYDVGDKIKSRDNFEIIIESIEQQNGLFVYHSHKGTIIENEIDDRTGFNSSEKKLLRSAVDDLKIFNLRYEALKLYNFTRQSDVFGFTGGRIDIVPHQFFIAEQVSKRKLPRALLSDEVGLGKTIEALLILHRLILTKQVKRVLIIVPDQLVNQWYIEMLKKFNLIFTIYDDIVYNELKKTAIDSNPFLDSQQILSSYSFIVKNETITEQILDCSWDMIIIDEAHNIKYDSQLYKVLHELSLKVSSLILLTATPEQLGEENHFQRLMLLDPSRYYDFKLFLEEHENYQFISNIIDKLINKAELKDDEKNLITDIFKDTKLKDIMSNEKKLYLKNNRDVIIKKIIDRYGTGRGIFRNTRDVIKGFPERIVHIINLTENTLTNLIQEAKQEFEKNDLYYELDEDCRINWIINFFKTNNNKKALIICSNKEKAKAIKNSLAKKYPVLRTILFHEDLDLLTRDKNAAYFQADNGAQCLISSEIGSEGRNFQFVNNLILFDVPSNPDLLEQRIGRLDRIGQKMPINIYVFSIEKTHLEILTKWYNDGLNAFRKNLNTGNKVYTRFYEELKALCLNIYDNYNKLKEQINKTLENTKKYNNELIKLLKKGKDRLLEINSFDEAASKKITSEIKEHDKNDLVENFMLAALDYFGIRINYLNERTYFLKSGNIKTDAFADIIKTGIRITFDRNKALLREDFLFISIDSSLLQRLFDLILGNEEGNTSFGIYYSDHGNEEILLETIFIPECICSFEHNIEKYFSTTPIRIVINHLHQDLTSDYSFELFYKNLKKGNADIFLKKDEVKKNLIPDMVKESTKIATNKISTIKKDALKKIKHEFYAEIERLKELKKINKYIKNEEIQMLEDELHALEHSINNAGFRLDAVRFIWKTGKK